MTIRYIECSLSASVRNICMPWHVIWNSFAKHNWFFVFWYNGKAPSHAACFGHWKSLPQVGKWKPPNKDLCWHFLIVLTWWEIRGLLACLPFSVAVPANRCRWSSGWRAPGLEGLARCHGQGLRGHTVWCFRVEIGFTYYYGRTFEDASRVSHAGLHSWNVLTSGPGNICKYPILLLPGPCLRQFQVHAGLLHNFWHEVPRPCNPNWWDGCAKKRWPSRVGSHSSCIVLLDYVNILYIACMEDVDGSNSHSHIYSFQTCVSQATKALNP